MDTPQDLAAVEALLAERDALHGWIARLDDAGSNVPAPVRARVRDDYERRLDLVTERLVEHAGTIATRLDDDRREHADLSARATAAREALAEAELRFAVGEYDLARFDEERNSHASDIESYDVSLAAAAERIARLEDVHALVSRAPRPVQPATTTFAPAAELPAVEPVAEELPDAVIRTEGDYDDGLPAIGIGELAPDDADQLLSIFDDDADGDVVAPARDDAGLGALSFRPSGASTDEHSAMRSAPSPWAAPAEPVRMVVPEPPPVDAAFIPVAPPAHAPTPDASSPVARTVRCGECGAMNKPMEWYCEKCGAELTAV